MSKTPGRRAPFIALEHIESQTGKVLTGWDDQPIVADDAADFDTGDVLFGKLRPYLHKIWHADRPGQCSTELLVLRPTSSDLLSRYLYYLAMSSGFVGWANATSYGTKMPRTSWQQLGEYEVQLPPVAAQRALAEYLDRETARIDALVEKKRRLIGLLEEKRTALITHVVTKGLDPSVPMKDSGIPWLGMVPAHWRVTPLKHVATPGTGHTPSRQHPEYWVDCNVPWFTLADVSRIRDGWTEQVSETSEYVSDLGLANSSAVRHPAGTVFFSRTASIGFSAVMGVDMATSQDFVTWTPGRDVRSLYLLYIFRAMRDEFSRLTMGSTHKTIYMPDALNVVGPIPPLHEQDAIVAELQKRLYPMRSAIEKLRHQLSLLAEHRQALITAAVTGQIDVTRGTANPEEVLS